MAEKLTTLGLDHPASCLAELVEEATRDALAPLGFLDLVLTRQLERKDERRVATMLKLSGLPPGKTLESFDWSFQPRVDRRAFEALATCSFIREKTNVLFLRSCSTRPRPRLRGGVKRGSSPAESSAAHSSLSVR